MKSPGQMAIPFLHTRKLRIDLFAGGGGASKGFELALGEGPDVAINHDPIAVAVHAANHPKTHHRCESVFASKPTDVCRGRAVGYLWASPDCTDHSKAKGDKPRDSKRRALADVVVDWARDVRPDVIFLENVEEFADWGPLGPDGKRDKRRKGELFAEWWAKFEALGYVGESREIRACDFGAPTTRNRLYIVFRCDGLPIAWPAPTHGAGLAPYRSAASCIDFSLPCPSIFLSAKQARELGLKCKRPLAEKTLARIARGTWKYVINAARPFLIPVTHGGGRDDFRTYDIAAPAPTFTGAHRGEIAYVAPTLVQTGYGERPGQAPRSLDLARPMGVVVGCGVKQALVSAFLAKHYGERRAGEVMGSALERPAGAFTARDHHALVTTHLAKLYGTSTGADAADPMHTVTATGNHIAEVRAFLIKYYGAGAAKDLREPIDTITTLDRFGLVIVDGTEYVIADIGMRMLVPRELFRGQGFPDSYVIDIEIDGEPITKEAQTRLAGNSVCPDVAAAIIACNAVEARDRARVAA